LDTGAARNPVPAVASVAAPATSDAAGTEGAVISEADVRSALGRRVSPGLRFRFAVWPGQPEQWVVLSFQAVPFGANNQSLDPRVTLLERRGGALVSVAEARIERQKAKCSNHFDGPEADADDDRAPNFELEPSPYEIAREGRAIGVRYSCSENWPAADTDEEFLYLLESTGKRLRQVLEAQIGFRHYDRPMFTDTSGIGTLSALPEAGKAGYFDLVLRMSTTIENQNPERRSETPAAPAAPAARAATDATTDETEATEKSVHEATQRFTWDGARYRALAAAPH
jgi:hypothetical protein